MPKDETPQCPYCDDALCCASCGRAHPGDDLTALRAALTLIRDTPYSMVNDSESLRHSCRLMCKIASDALGGK